MKKLILFFFIFCSLSSAAQNPIQQARPANIRDGINYMGNGSVVLSLFAPYKNNVYVLGDFNNWTVNTTYLMKKDVVDSDHVYWWIELTGLNNSTEYAFQYLIDGSLRVADPYTEKVLDPNHDKYIDNSTYPNLKQYPAGQSEITSVLFPSNTAYTFQNTNSFVRPAKEKLTIYELHMRDFVSAHSFKTLSDTLAYLKRLGINAIELMPINEFEGNSSWGYNPSFYFAVDKYYGPADQLKKLIDKCHGEGIAVIIDLVLNHSYNASPLVRMYFDGTSPTSQNPWYNRTCVNEHCWGNDFNHTSTATQYFVDRITEHWLKNYHFDGIRFDFTKGFTQTAGNNWNKDDSRIAIVKRMSDQVWKTDPNAYVILEHWTENSEETILADYGCMLWGNLVNQYGQAAMGFNQSTVSDLSWGYYVNRNWKNPRLVTYMESHDEERILYECITNGNNDGTAYDIKKLPTALNRSALDAAFLFTIPGPKMMWQFQELGYDYSIDYNNRVGEKPINWDYLSDVNRKALYDAYRKIIKLRLDHEVFTSPQTVVTMSVGSADGLKKIMLKHSSMNVVIIGNFGVKQGSVNPAFPAAGNWYDYIGNKHMFYNGTDVLNISLAPGEYRIYTSVDIQTTLSYNHINTAMYLTGTFNAWNTSSHPMQLIADNTWKITGVPLSAIDYSFKFTNAADWKGNDWGNAAGLSGTAVMTTGGGSNSTVTIPKSGMYTITFNEKTLSYSIYQDILTDTKQSISFEGAFSICPNPIAGNKCVILNPANIAVDNIKIMDITGRIVSDEMLISTEKLIEVAIDEPAGVYLIAIQHKNGVQVMRFVKT